MRKKISFLLIVLMLTSIIAGCSSKPASSSKAEKKNYKIGVVTPTLSTSEDEFRAAEKMVKKYPGIVKHITLPENFSTEIETGLSQITSLADDPNMKAIIVYLRPGRIAARPAKGKRKEA